jgi:hypothetical protein
MDYRAHRVPQLPEELLECGRRTACGDLPVRELRLLSATSILSACADQLWVAWTNAYAAGEYHGSGTKDET